MRGLARVLAVGAAPAIEPGTGTVITGRFTHVRDDLLDVWVEGLAEPIGCTSRHPFWSVTRERWLPAHALSPGEWLESHGQRVQVVSVNFRASGERLRRSVTPATR